MPELLTATSVGLLLAGGSGFLLVEAARENLRSVADMTVEQEAAQLQARLMRLLREMSSFEGAVFALPAVTNGGAVPGYHSLIVARGPAPDFPRSEVRFDATEGRIWFRNDRLDPNSERILFESRPGRVVVRDVVFAPALKPDGTVDNSVIRVTVEMDDDGWGRRNPVANTSRVRRTFAVKMRNS